MERLEFNRQVAEAARAIANEKHGEHTLELAVQMAIDLIPHCDLAGLTVFRPDGINTAAASHSDLRLIDEVQYQLGEGPCIDELRETDVVTVIDVSTDPRWPRWGPYIAEHFDIRSSMSVRLFNEGHHFAAMNLYARRPDAFNADDLADGLVIAAQAAVTMAATMELSQLQQAIQSRQVIGEAVGMLRERFALTSDRAFDVLKRLSSQQNVKVFTIAQHVVETGTLPDPPDPTVTPDIPGPSDSALETA